MKQSSRHIKLLVIQGVLKVVGCACIPQKSDKHRVLVTGRRYIQQDRRSSRPPKGVSQLHPRRRACRLLRPIESAESSWRGASSTRRAATDATPPRSDACAGAAGGRRRERAGLQRR
eukprot:6188577-Pleurochrysis_carterae.AAC.1